MSPRSGNILIVDDEATSAIVRAVRRRLEEEGWGTQVVSKEEHGSADDMLWAALHAIDGSATRRRDSGLAPGRLPR